MPTEGPGLRLHARVECSFANGPGRRAVLWLQGCSLGCPGCFNPATHDPEAGSWYSSAELVDWILELEEIEGLTISGGEPLEQAQGVLALLDALRCRSSLSVLLFSGFTRAEIESRSSGPEIIAHCDALIDGRYVSTRPLGHGLRGSENQRLILLTDRFEIADFARLPVAEILIDCDGNLVASGVDPIDLSSLYSE